ncbi:DUF2235 domain-containing protein [Sphingomonas bacterium]|uniref:phospholipase effector Tle1 domain-containing protein n=1 Tax=Sphingomonas bacterium TaxID=1895847 RepID=UPI00261EABE6|nr:DUF2235 domain-containing protein [Sphingomonas bacterium]
MLVTACTTTSIADYYANAVPLKHRKLVVVIDGTGNEPRDHTNAFRLHELIANQNRDDIATFYTEGVGSDSRAIGLATGWGMGKDVRDAYRFLAERWQPGDEIYVIGFSRGAFGGRILQGMIYSAGLVDFVARRYTLDQREKIVDRLYDANKMFRRLREREPSAQIRRMGQVDGVLRAFDLARRPARVSAVAYWDTVAAMGLPDGTPDPDKEDRSMPYLDQFCNVDYVFHALSLDDNRPKDFTPISASGYDRQSMCSSDDPPPIIDEVWFSGAHADLGGTYTAADGVTFDGYLSGVSLNWMISRLAGFELTPPGASVYANWRDVIHDARRNKAFYRRYDDDSRDVFRLARQSGYNWGVPRVHFTVQDRLAELYVLPALNAQCAGAARKPPILCSDWLDRSRFMRYLKNNGCLDPVYEPGPYRRQRGWRFADSRRSANDLEVVTKCVVLVYDTPEQRDAALP